MFFTIKDDDKEIVVYEFGNPKKPIKRAVRSHYPWVWRRIGTVVIVPSFALLIVSFIKLFSSAPPEKISDAEMLPFFLSAMASIVPWIILFFIGGIILATGVDIRETRRKITQQKMRDLYVTSKDWSYKVLFSNRTETDEIKTELIEVIAGYFGDKDVIKADRVIRRSMNGKKKTVKEYDAKRKLIHLAQAMYLSNNLANSVILEGLAEQHAAVDDEMHPQLQEALDEYDAGRRFILERVMRTQPSVTAE